MPRFRLLSPIDRLPIFLCGLGLLTLLRASHPWVTVELIVAVSAFLVGLSWVGKQPHAGDLIHAFVQPYAAVALTFELIGRVIEAVNGTRWDAVLSSIDERWFSGIAFAWHHALGRPAWLTSLAAVAYVSFYVFPAAVGAAMFFKRPRQVFDDFVFTTMAAFFIPFVGYLAMPTQGPRAGIPVDATAVEHAATSFVHAVELSTLDAFPSGHTTATLVVAVLGIRAFPRFAVPVAAAACAIVFSTVYLSYHYVVDVLAGALLAAAMPVLAAALRYVCGERDVAAPATSAS